MIKHYKISEISSPSLAFSMLSVSENLTLWMKSVKKKKFEGKQNNNRKTFLRASHCIYLKFLKMYITF